MPAQAREHARRSRAHRVRRAIRCALARCQSRSGPVEQRAEQQRRCERARNRVGELRSNMVDPRSRRGAPPPTASTESSESRPRSAHSGRPASGRARLGRAAASLRRRWSGRSAHLAADPAGAKAADRSAAPAAVRTSPRTAQPSAVQTPAKTRAACHYLPLDLASSRRGPAASGRGRRDARAALVAQVRGASAALRDGRGARGLGAAPRPSRSRAKSDAARGRRRRIFGAGAGRSARRRRPVRPWERAAAPARLGPRRARHGRQPLWQSPSLSKPFGTRLWSSPSCSSRSFAGRNAVPAWVSASRSCRLRTPDGREFSPDRASSSRVRPGD